MQGEALEKQQVLAIQALRLKGFSVRKCAELLNVSKASVERHGKEVAAGPVTPIVKKDREERLGKIVDLASERLVDELNDAKKLSPALLNVIMGTAWDKLYAKAPADMDAPMNLMINLFGHGAGEKLAATLGRAAAGEASKSQHDTGDATAIHETLPTATPLDE